MGYIEVGTEVWAYNNKGDQIEGVYMEVQKEVGEHKANLYTMSLGPNKLLKVWGSTVLDDKMKYLEIGEKIRITYEGKNDKGIKLFKVEADR